MRFRIAFRLTHWTLIRSENVTICSIYVLFAWAEIYTLVLMTRNFPEFLLLFQETLNPQFWSLYNLFILQSVQSQEMIC